MDENTGHTGAGTGADDAAADWSPTATDAYELPAHVTAAIDDARAWVGVEFAEEPDTDLRGTVIPAFYRHAAGFHCAYRD